MIHVNFQVDGECFFLMVQLWLSLLLLVLWFVSLFAGDFVVVVAVLGFVFLCFSVCFLFFMLLLLLMLLLVLYGRW